MPLTRRFVACCFFFAIIFCASGLYAQSPADTFSSRLKSSVAAYYKKYPAEKVFVHTNQDIYFSGETMWYKVYTVAYGKPSLLSTIIYTRLTDTAGNVIMQNRLPLVDGVAHGNFDINRQLKSGWYKLTAFTSWMMNFGEESYYQQKVFIRNLAEPNLPPGTHQAKKPIYHVSFYPEGGDLIDDNLLAVAFRAWTEDGAPVKVEGVVKDKANAVVAKLITIHDGMGRFDMEPIANNSYTAAVQFPDGSRQEIKLPEVQQNGIYLRAVQGNAAVQLKMAYVGPAEKFSNCTLAAFQNNGQVSTYPLKLVKGINRFDIQKADFSTGILRLTVFDSDNIPCAERILFINKHDIQPGVIKADTLSFDAAAPNGFSLKLKDEAGRPVNGSFSVAVTDAAAFNDSPDQNIFSALLLSPELKGVVNNPAYYFKNNDDSLARQLDLVMLTNGWRHFVWQKILSNEGYALKYPVEKPQYIAGKIDGYQMPLGEKDKSQIPILIMNQDSTKFIGHIMPDTTDSFILKDFNHSGISDVYLQVRDKKGRAQKLKSHLFPTLADSIKRIITGPFASGEIPDVNGYYLSAARAEALTLTNTIMLKPVDIKSAKTSPVQKLINDRVSSIYQSEREYTLDLVNSPVVNIGLVNYIQGRFPGLQIIDDGHGITFTYRGVNSLTKMKGSGPDSSSVPYCYLNEVHVFFSDIQDIELSNVALIRFIPPPAGFAPFNGGNVGALMIYTKRQADEVLKVKGMADYDHFIFNGYSIAREFSSPDYSKPGADIHADYRTTLFWGHDMTTDSKGALKFHFYNSSHAKKFRVIVQGMDAQGRLAYLEQVF